MCLAILIAVLILSSIASVFFIESSLPETWEERKKNNYYPPEF